MRRVRTALLVGLQLVGSPALAEDDSQLWTQVVASGPVAHELGLFLYGESRFGDNLSRLSQTLLGVGLGWERGHGNSLYGGYLLVNTYPRAGKAPREHRLWQQLAYPIGSLGSARISGRTLLEQRYFEGFHDIGVRLQQNVRAALPVTRDGRVRLVAYGELLFNFNDADWGARPGIDQFRGFGGANFAVGRNSSLEVGYFHQNIVRRGAEDRINHVAQVTFSRRLGR